MKKNLNLTIASILLVLFISLSTNSCSTDKCKGITCQNGGTCNDGTCACANGYEGVNCQTRVNTKFEGTFTKAGDFDCNSNVLAIGVAASNINPVAINLDFSEAALSWVDLEATVSGNSITVNPQAKNVEGSDYIITGTGSLNGNAITVYLTLEDVNGGSPSICTFTGSK